MKNPKDMLVSDDELHDRFVRSAYEGPMELVGSIVAHRVRKFYESELAKLRSEKDELVGALRSIAHKADHQIPAYATEETQAGSYLAGYLSHIEKMALSILAKHKSE